MLFYPIFTNLFGAVRRKWGAPPGARDAWGFHPQTPGTLRWGSFSHARKGTKSAPGFVPADAWGPRKNPAKRFLWGEEPQGSARSFHQQVETEQSGLCGDEFAGSRPGRRGTFSYTRESTQRACPGGGPPGYPPLSWGAYSSFRRQNRHRRGPFGGLRPGATRLAASSTQRGACPGVRLESECAYRLQTPLLLTVFRQMASTRTAQLVPFSRQALNGVL